MLWLLLACHSDPGLADRWWGPELAADLDDSDKIVSIALTAGASEIDWGKPERTAVWSYDDQIPGPVITATLGQELRVAFQNQLEAEDPDDAATTVHWHGLTVPNDQDGVALVMDPVQSGESFDYDYNVPLAGTYWYHPHLHSNVQVERGLSGAMVFLDPEDPIPDMERLIYLDDVDLQPDGQIAPFNEDESQVNSTWGRLGNTLLLNGIPINEGPVTATAKGGTVERWRLVNAANARHLNLRVEGAAWRVIAMDGHTVAEPWSPDSLELVPGGRVDLEVRPAESDATLWLSTIGTDGAVTELPALVGAVENPHAAADPLDWHAPEVDAIVAPEQELTLTLEAIQADTAMNWSINGESWMGCEDGNLLGDPIPLDGGVPTRITIVNDTDVHHPFHMHGNLFQVSAIDGLPPEHSGDRDTVGIEPNATLEIFSQLDNPGIWMAHCHILEHAAQGMMTAFTVSAAP